MRWRMADGGWRKNARLFAALLVGWLVACARTPQGPPPARIPPPQPTPLPVEPAPVAPRLTAEGTVDGASGKLWYHIVGQGPDTVLVPLGTWLEPGLAALGERHTLVFFDPRHRGRSHALTDSMAATFDGDVADVEAVRMAMGSPRVAVIGYDYYAGVAAAWAATHPQAVTRIILLSPIEPADTLSRTWNPPERMTRLDTTAARALVKARAAGKDTSDATGYCEQFWRVNMRLFVSDTVRASAIRPEWCQWPNESPARVADAAGRALSSLGPAIDLGARAVGVSVPTLVIHGRQDLVANPEGAREWARRISGARVLWLSNVGHLPHLEAGQIVAESINDFLAGRWPPRAGPP